MIPHQTLIKQFQSTLSTPPIIVAITKKQPEPKLEEAYHAGYRHFGENTLKGIERTSRYFKDKKDVKLHFVGNLQSNKIKKLSQLPLWMIQSISKTKHLDLFKSIHLDKISIPELLLQINIAHNPNQAGFDPNQQDIDSLIHLYQMLPINGLMGLGPNPNRFSSNHDWIEETKNCFLKFQYLYSALKQKHPKLKHLSMGMTNDYQIATHYGATMIRLGTLIFGERH